MGLWDEGLTSAVGELVAKVTYCARLKHPVLGCRIAKYWVFLLKWNIFGL